MSLIIPHTYTVDIANGTSRQKILVPMVRGDGNAHQVTVTLLDHGTPAVTTGYTAVLYAVRAGDRITVPNPGTIVGNVVSALILADSLYVNGRVDLLLKLAKAGDNEISPLWVEAECAGGVTGTYSDPENIISSLSELLAQIAACGSATTAAVAATGAANTAASSVGAAIAPAYNAAATYAIGDICTYLGTRYKCSTAITVAEAWTAGHWSSESVQGALDAHTSQLADIATLFDRSLSYRYQYLKMADLITGSMWSNNNNPPGIASQADQNRYPVIALAAGTYYLSSTIAATGAPGTITAVFSRVQKVSDGSVTNLKTYLGSGNDYSGPVTFTEAVNLYLTVHYSNTNAMVTDGDTRPATYGEGLIEFHSITDNVNDIEDMLLDSTGNASTYRITKLRVGASVLADYTTIASALNAIEYSSSYNRYIIEIEEGEYNEYGLNLPDYVSLAGISGDRESVWIKGELPDSATDAQITPTSTISATKHNNLKNLKITAKNLRYPVHDDSSATGVAWKKNIENCHIEHYGNAGAMAYRIANSLDYSNLWSSCHAWGAGMPGGSRAEFTDCIFKSVEKPWYTHEGASQSAPYLCKFRNCQFIQASTDPLGSYEPSMQVDTGLNSGFADKIIIENCYLNKYLNVDTTHLTEIEISGCGILPIHADVTLGDRFPTNYEHMRAMFYTGATTLSGGEMLKRAGENIVVLADNTTPVNMIAGYAIGQTAQNNYVKVVQRGYYYSLNGLEPMGTEYAVSPAGTLVPATEGSITVGHRYDRNFILLLAQ